MQITPKSKIILYKIIAEFLFIFHGIAAIILLFFWYFKPLYLIYLVTLIISLISDMLFGYCFLSQWEFYFRKKIDSTLDYEHTFFSFYFNKYFGQKISTRTVQITVLIFLWVSMFINILYWVIKR